MADEMTVGRATLKRRNPWGVWLLNIVTFGIYGLVWYYKINTEMRDYAERRIKVEPIMAVIAITFGAILAGIPVLVSLYRTADRVRQAQVEAGAQERISPVGALLLGLLGFYHPYVQSQLNKAWDVEFARPQGQAAAPVAETPI